MIASLAVVVFLWLLLNVVVSVARMTKGATTDRIVRALQSGPLYEGALELVLDGPRDFRRALRTLQDRGVIERNLPDDPQTWKLTS